MHLKPYPKPLDKEIHRESVHDGTRGLHADQQGVLRKEWGVRQVCGLMGTPGNGTANRCPLRVISTLRCGSGSNAPTRISGARKSRASPLKTFTSSLVLLSPSTGLENESSLRNYKYMDIWAVIKPGNTKEKIAIFASKKCSSTYSSVVDNTSETEAIAPELLTVSVKNKSCLDLDKLSSAPKTLESIETSQCGLGTCSLKDMESSCISREETSTAVETLQSISECSEEPIPGMLFAKSSPQSLKEHHLPSPSKSRSPNKKPSDIQDLEPSVDTSLSFREEIKDGLVADQNHQTFQETERGETCIVSQEPVPFPLRRLVSHEFLETRFKIQLLLEPRQYMAFLPHHIIVKIFCLLPTESLAALKCTCHYFKFIIESYAVRPADSCWVSDPRYKDDPWAVCCQ